MLFWILYGIDVFERLSKFGLYGFWISIAFFGVATFAWCINTCDGDSTFTEFLKKIKKFAWIPIICLVINIFTPTKNTILISAGFQAGKEIIMSEPVNELFNKSYILLNQQLDKAIEKAETKDGK